MNETIALGNMELIIIFVILFLIVAGIISVVTTVILLFKARSKSKYPSSLTTQSERLKELQKMKDNDLITADEFDKKRNEILSSL